MVDLDLGKTLSESAREYANATISALKVPGGIHPPTAIAGCARMAGMSLFRSFHLRLPGVPPGQPVLSAEADREAPMLLRIAAGILANLGITLPGAPPETMSDPGTQPIRGFLETQRLLDPVFSPIQASRVLSDRQAAQAQAIATALLIHHFAKNLEPGIGFGVAALGFIEGSKTAPEPVRSTSDAAG